MKTSLYGENDSAFSSQEAVRWACFVTIGSFEWATGDLTSVKAAEIKVSSLSRSNTTHVVSSELTEADSYALIREIPKHARMLQRLGYLVYRPIK